MMVAEGYRACRGLVNQEKKDQGEHYRTTAVIPALTRPLVSFSSFKEHRATRNNTGDTNHDWNEG